MSHTYHVATRVYRIVDSTDTKFKFALLDETDLVRILGDSPMRLADHALEVCNANSVRHDYAQPYLR